MSIKVTGLNATKSMLKRKTDNIQKGRQQAMDNINNMLGTVADRIYRQRTYDGRRVKRSIASLKRKTSGDRKGKIEKGGKSLNITGQLMNSYIFKRKSRFSAVLSNPYSYSKQMLTDFRILPKEQDFIRMIKKDILSNNNK